MMNKKVYLILFYISLILTSVMQYVACKTAGSFFYFGELFSLALPCIILIVVGGIGLTVLFIKKDLKASIVCPIIYLVFLTSVYLLANHYFSDSVYNVYMLYYSKIVFVGFVFLILYTCLCFSKKDKVLKKTK